MWINKLTKLILLPVFFCIALNSCSGGGGSDKFTITWKNYDDTVLATDFVKSGETPSYSGSTPKKPSTAEYDYTFAGWSPTPAPISSNQTYKAQFSESIRKYTVTVTSEDSSRGTVSGGGLHAYNSSVTIEATPNTGYSFEGWYKDGQKVPSASASYTFNMPANDVSYEARFTVNQYTVRVTSEDISKGVVSYSGTTFAYGSNVTIVATPNTGYSFEGWYKNGVKVPSAPAFYTFTMPASNVSYEARFTINSYTVTLAASPSEGGTVTGKGTYAYNSDVNILATPKTGYKFNGWYEGKTFISNESTYNFKMPAKNIIYTAKFANKNAWFYKSDWWNYCSNGKDGEQATKEDIGQEVNLTVNGQVHKVRLIDVNHDILSDDASKTAHCTFEFVNLLSDKDGYSIATLWNTNDKRSSTNYGYLNSDLRKALNGSGTGALRWYQKGSDKKSTDYTRPVIEMLPSDLQNNIKTVKKSVAITNTYSVASYEAKVFALTYREMTQAYSDYAKEEGNTYQYYKDHDEGSSRIKQQVKGHKDAVTVSTKITDTDITWYASNYAGFNNSTERFGGYYWLSSPRTYNNNSAWDVCYNGEIYDGYNVCGTAFAVAPAFCI